MKRRNEFLQGALVLAGGMLLDRTLRYLNQPNAIQKLASSGRRLLQAWASPPQIIVTSPPTTGSVVEDAYHPPSVPLASMVPPPDPVRGNQVFTRTFEEMEAMEALKAQQAEKGSALENKSWLEM